MAIQFKILYKFREPSTNLIDLPKVHYDLDDFVLVLEFFDRKEQKKKYKAHFKDVFGFKYSTRSLCTMDDIEAYGQIIEVIDSDWLKEFDETDEIFTHTEKEELHHYRTYFDEIGVYEFIAKSFEVEEV